MSLSPEEKERYLEAIIAGREIAQQLIKAAFEDVEDNDDFRDRVTSLRWAAIHLIVNDMLSAIEAGVMTEEKFMKMIEHDFLAEKSLMLAEKAKGNVNFKKVSFVEPNKDFSGVIAIPEETT